MFPLGVAYFVFFVTAFAFGGALIWTFIGPPVILLALYVSLYIGDLEASMVNATTGEDIRRPPRVVDADICEALYISEGTVKTHIRHILAKLELTDRTQVVVFAYEVVLPAQRPASMALAR